MTGWLDDVRPRRLRLAGLLVTSLIALLVFPEVSHAQDPGDGMLVSSISIEDTNVSGGAVLVR